MLNIWIWFNRIWFLTNLPYFHVKVPINTLADVLLPPLQCYTATTYSLNPNLKNVFSLQLQSIIYIIHSQIIYETIFNYILFSEGIFNV